jgi:hypothetical protein
MKKVSGLLMLLLACSLVSTLVAAEPFGVSNEIALDFDLVEAKTIAQEEVAGVAGEILAVPVSSIQPEMVSNIMVIPDAGFEAGSKLHCGVMPGLPRFT